MEQDSQAPMDEMGESAAGTGTPGEPELTAGRPPLKMGMLLGGLTSLAVMGLAYLANELAGLPFVPFDLFDWLARVLPGNVLTLGIDVMVDTIIALDIGSSTSQTAKLLEQMMALVMFVAIGAVLGATVAWLSRRRPGRRAGAAAGLVLLMAVATIELDLGFTDNLLPAAIWLGVLLVGWGVFLGAMLSRRPAAAFSSEERAARRDLLLKLAGGSAAVALGSWGVGRLIGRSAEREASPILAEGDVPLPVPTAEATIRDRIQPAPGTRMELTSNDDFYRIDINTRPPEIALESWVLATDGLFDRPRDLTLDDLLAYPAVTQPITLSCISNRIAGDLIGTSNWTGARLRDVVRDLGLKPAAKELHIEAVDGFFESVAMEDIMDPRTLLVYAMNGEPLPQEHGSPLRIYIPDRYGMKQPKWITRITAIDEEGPGYWVVRGWSEEARPQIVSVIDVINTDPSTADGKISIGGIAWAGDRGIQKVELQFDGGDWVEATLRVPPLSPLTWVQWRYDHTPEPGGHRVRVRATDGTGALQIETTQGVRPDGATGYHSLNFKI
jgi:DMSO/TMAO reductase YedYZ molybdopterin-dependent catalytic subunit